MVHLGFFQYIPLIFAEYIVFCVGGDAYIDPWGSYEFAGDFRKNGFICRVGCWASNPIRKSGKDFVLNIRPGG